MDAAQKNTPRSLAEITADMATLRQERAAAIEALNEHRPEDRRGRAYTIAEVLERLRFFRAAHPDSEMLLWYEGRARIEGLAEGRLREPLPVTSVHSWRARYDEPAIGGARYDKAEPFTLSKAIDEIERLTVDVFHGYKGGDYEYDHTNRLFVDDYGDWSGENIIVGVIEFTAPTGDPGVMLVSLSLDEA